MRNRSWVGVLLLLIVGAPGLSAQDNSDTDGFQTRVWLDRGNDPMLQRGDRVRIYYRTSSDAYVAIFHIDTDGNVRLLSPRTPDDDHFVRGGRDYRLLFPQTPDWFVDEAPGKGYFFAVASPEPFDFAAFEYRPYERGWDLSQVGRTVYQDPYVAMDEYVARLVPDWQTVPYALDFLSYDVGEAHDYPRFLCYECHQYQAYSAWNPYAYACDSFRVVIWDDPYFYPVYRYRGTKVVFAQPQPGLARFEFKERAAGESWKPLTRTRQPPMRRSVEYAEPAVAAPEMPEFVPPRRKAVPREPQNNGADVRGVQPRGGRGVAPDPAASPGSTPRRGLEPPVPTRPGDRPTSTLPGRTIVAPPSGAARPSRPDAPRTAQPSSGTARPSRPGDPAAALPRSGATPPRSGERPVLQRRPSTPPRSGGRPAAVKPPATAKPRPPKRPGGVGSQSARPSGGRPTTGGAPRARVGSPASGGRPPARPAAKPRKPGGKPGGSSPPPPPRVRRPGGGGAHRTPPRGSGGGGG